MPVRFLIFILIFTACNAAPGKEKIIADAGDTAQNDMDTVQSEARHLYRDNFMLNGQSMIRVRNGNNFINLITEAGDTIVEAEGNDAYCRFPDIDGDGYKDIRVYYRTGDITCETYLYDTAAHTYQDIKNTSLDFQQLAGTPYYYAHNRTGLAACYWESHLMEIQAWRIVNIARMNVNACDDKNDGIQLYKVNKGAEHLTERLSLPAAAINTEDSQSAFEKNYWAQHYKQFE